MLKSIKHLGDAKVAASDGDIGHVKDTYFDDRSWAVRYLVLDTGSWLSGREVLISPYSVKPPIDGDEQIRLTLTQRQVSNSPDVDTHQPVSRQHERELLRYYEYPEYWAGNALWGMGAMPYPLPLTQDVAEREADRGVNERNFRATDIHLRSTDHVTGYDIQATDDSIGTVQDFIFDDQNWAIRYLVVDTSRWWEGGHNVLVGMNWADSIDWATQKVHVRLTRAQVKASPLFEGVNSIHREYETRLHSNYERPGYWM